MNTPRVLVWVGAFVVAAVGAWAHEFWLQPVNFRPAVGVPVGVRIMVGDGFPGEARPRDPRKALRFDATGPGGAGKPVAVAGNPGDEPAGTFTFERAGVWALAYRGAEVVISLEARQFEDYLREQGLTHVLKARAERGESAAAGREGYSRCAKTLVCAGGDTAGAWDARTGLQVEIVPERNPYAAAVGDSVAFTLLRDGKPVPDAQLMALSVENGKTVRTTARTDESGSAAFTLHRPGLWIINTVVMDRVEATANRTDVDWVSVWSSLTFEMGAQPK